MFERTNHILLKTGFRLVMIVFFVWSLFPVCWLVITSLRPNFAPLQDGNPFIFNPGLENYRSILNNRELLRYFFNSLFTGITATVLSLVFGTLAAYGLARFRFSGRRLCLQWILSIRLLPPIGFVVPLFIMFKTFDLLDTPATLVVVYTAFLLPFSIWMLTSVIREIPIEAEEAALVDGCNRFQGLIRILLPQLWPSLAAVGLLNITAAWNEFLYALVLTSSKAVTLPVAITAFLGDRGIYWGEITAAAALTAVVPIGLLILIHRHLFRGFGQWAAS